MNPLNKILWGVGAGIVLFITIIIIWLSLAKAHLEVQLAHAEASNTSCQLANDEFRQTTEQQNHAIELLRHPKVAQPVATKKTGHDDYREWLQRQKPSGDACQAASALIDQAVARMK